METLDLQEIFAKEITISVIRAGSQSNGCLRSLWVITNFAPKVMCGPLESWLGRSSALESHPTKTYLFQKWSNMSAMNKVCVSRFQIKTDKKNIVQWKNLLIWEISVWWYYLIPIFFKIRLNYFFLNRPSGNSILVSSRIKRSVTPMLEIQSRRQAKFWKSSKRHQGIVKRNIFIEGTWWWFGKYAFICTISDIW